MTLNGHGVFESVLAMHQCMLGRRGLAHGFGKNGNLEAKEALTFNFIMYYFVYLFILPSLLIFTSMLKN